MEGMPSRVLVLDRRAGMQALSLWLLLLSILTHALIPTGSPLQRTAGSAFSATTSEVSLAPRRQLATDQAELRNGSRGSDEGAGSPEPETLSASAPAIVPPAIAPSGVVLRGFDFIGDPGGAAPFDARAPPLG